MKTETKTELLGFKVPEKERDLIKSMFRSRQMTVTQYLRGAIQPLILDPANAQKKLAA